MKNFLIVLVAVVSFALPILLAIFWRKKTNCNWFAFAVGTLCFVLFVNTLESLANYLLFYKSASISSYLSKHPFIYTLLGAFMAGIFEETGRLFGYKVLLKKFKDKCTAIGYGIGHGGMECVLVLGVSYILYIVVIFGGSLGEPEADLAVLNAINSIDINIIPLAIIERVAAMMVHISLSILVFKACSNKKFFYLFPISILTHTLIDIPAGLYQTQLITSPVLVEAMILFLSALLFYICVNIYKKMK